MSNVAETILAQLGHSTGRMRVMIGAYDFTAGAHSFTFKFKAKNEKRINACTVTLMPSDTYKVEFFRIAKKYDITTVTTLEDVYADRLRTVFERETGLYLSLGTMTKAS